MNARAQAATEFDLPERIENTEQLEEALSRPPRRLVEMMARLEGDLMLIGAGGKMGPSLARMARRACDASGVARRVIAVSRFSSPAVADSLETDGIEIIRCDLFDPDAFARLPDVENIVYMAARKFGSYGQEGATWATNCFLPGLVCQKFGRSRIVGFSTGNVYPLVPIDSGGSREQDPLEPIGEYAASAVGRERLLGYFSEQYGFPAAILRLNYAHELRYGIIVDIAQKVAAGEPVDVTMGYFNAIWQGDANAMSLLALEHAASPPLVVNVAGPETLRVRDVAEQLGQELGQSVSIEGREAETALLSNGRRAYELFGRPIIPEGQIIRWIADWIGRGGPTHGKPTKFEVRDGQF
ncbi:MAG: NAD(P)-dependent oxidoreductase [Pirellulales bacterium]